jgi:predicted SnoaL-like aldol condensation-catalyzing enzyme
MRRAQKQAPRKFLLQNGTEMAKEHPNVALLKRFDLRDPASWGEVMAEDIVWHYANPNLPDLNGDHVGLGGVSSFFQTIGARFEGTFNIHPVSVTPIGNELVVVQSRNTLVFEGDSVAVDVVVVWRIVRGFIVEVWDIVSGVAEVIHDG